MNNRISCNMMDAIVTGGKTLVLSRKGKSIESVVEMDGLNGREAYGVNNFFAGI